MKRKICAMLVMFSLLFSSSIAVKAGEENINNKALELQAEIDLLYQERAELCIDFEKNEEEIMALDAKIAGLGVEEISSEEAKEIIQNAENYTPIQQLRITVPSETGVSWTSSRNVYTYNGKQYEVQELRAVPSTSNSCLSVKKAAYTRKVTNVENTVRIAKTLTTSIAGYLPVLGGALGNGITIAQAIKDIFNVNASGTISSLEATYTTSLATEYTYNFVKTYGASDTGNQILCYAGNNVSTSTLIAIPQLIITGSSYYPSVGSKSYGGTQTSPLNSDRWNTACKNYYNYKTNGTNFSPYYTISYHDQQLMDGSTDRTAIPRAMSGF